MGCRLRKPLKSPLVYDVYGGDVAFIECGARIRPERLLDIPSAGGAEPGSVTDAGLRGNVSVAVRYLESWLRGVGAAAIDNLMEDAATAEISRSQVWQWVHQGVVTDSGTAITQAHVREVLADVLDSLPRSSHDRFDDAAALFEQVALADDFPTFLTVPAYTQHLVEHP